ncbi:MAG: hypothetical protein ACLP50_34435 [Solirubrobacteraceae bacterium]
MPPAKRSPSEGSTSSDSQPAAKRTSAKGRTSRTRGAAAKGTAAAPGTAAHTAGDPAGATAGLLVGTDRESHATVAEQLVKGVTKPAELVMLTAERIQETLDDAASRGRVTRKDANELVAELVRCGLHQSDDLLREIEALLERGQRQIEGATRRARGSDPVDRLVRGADLARRAAGVGPAFPIDGYDALNAGRVQSEIKQLSRADRRRVLAYERRHANRKTVVVALEKSLA